MLLTAATLSLIASMQRALFGQSRSTSAFLSAVARNVVPSITTTAAAPPREGEFRCAAAESAHPILSRAVAECVQQLRLKLGPGIQPDLIQLLIASDRHGGYIEMAPQFVLECLSTRGVTKIPTLFGGAIRQARESTQGSAAGISILAAHLPGVSVHSFHTKDSSLPDLGQGVWPRLLRAHRHPTGNDTAAADTGPQQAADATSGNDSASEGAAAFVLAEPHFSDAGALVQRLQGVLRETPVVGGVLPSCAWGPTRSLRGALFHGETTLDCGAVGCILSGGLQVDRIEVQGWQSPVKQIEADLKRASRSGAPSRGTSHLTSMMQSIKTHSHDETAARVRFAALLQQYAETLRAAHPTMAPESMAAFAYSAAVFDREECSAVLQALPQTAFQGAPCDVAFSDRSEDKGNWPTSVTTCAILRSLTSHTEKLRL